MSEPVPVFWVSHNRQALTRGYADQGLLEAILDRSAWRPPGALTFEHHEVRGDFPEAEGAIVVFNARSHTRIGAPARLARQLDRLSWAVVLICGDEEWSFPWRSLLLPGEEGQPEGSRRLLWAMQARPEHHALGKLPGGWYPGTHGLLAPCFPQALSRPLEWFFGGQVTHERRVECAEVLRGLPGGALVETDHYLAEKMPRAEYFRTMASAKVIPCPSGPYSVDCARAFEALEAGCVPVADVQPAYAPAFDYWALLFGEEPPFPRVSDWHDFPALLTEQLDAWPASGNRCSAFWQRYKRRLAHGLDASVHAARGSRPELASPDDLITVLVTTSPAPLHPSTEHLERTIGSVREQLPHAEIVLVADGVRPEQEAQRAAYEQYLQRALWLANYEWGNVAPLILDAFSHQANAVRAALELVETPLVLFIEHDCPLVGDIDWPGLCAFVGSGEANAVRLHIDPAIHPEHEHLMLDHETVWRGSAGPFQPAGVPVRRTVQWWQRPHLASARFYRERVMPLFPPSCRTMIEDKLYGIIASAWLDHGEAGWWDWRLWVYTPEGGELGMRRSGHLDSRGDDPKYPMRFE